MARSIIKKAGPDLRARGAGQNDVFASYQAIGPKLFKLRSFPPFQKNLSGDVTSGPCCLVLMAKVQKEPDGHGDKPAGTRGFSCSSVINRRLSRQTGGHHEDCRYRRFRPDRIASG
ncbi:MAG: hypothetical protein KGZ91_14040 [Afipia sp.]|nr:hypothetical protein [Afipia sp.]